jgi:hypothetical protein
VLKDVVDAGGPGLLIPAILFALVLYAARGLFGLHGRKNQNRREFLELWNPERVDDGLWLEVTVRHLFGTYLPAHVIRVALAHPASSQALIELSELWAFFHYDASNQTIRWKSSRHQKPVARKLSRYMPLLRYFGLALLGAACGLFAYWNDNSLIKWIYSFLALIFAIGALTNLMHDDAVKIADESGEDWIARINASTAIEIDRPSDEIASKQVSSEDKQTAPILDFGDGGS